MVEVGGRPGCDDDVAGFCLGVGSRDVLADTFPGSRDDDCVAFQKRDRGGVRGGIGLRVDDLGHTVAHMGRRLRFLSHDCFVAWYLLGIQKTISTDVFACVGILQEVL